MTASCLSSMPGIESLLGHERLMTLTWDQAANFSGFPISHTCLYAPSSSNLAEELTKYESPKCWSQRVPEQQRRQGLHIARSLSCSMRYLHYPNPESTRSIKKLRTNMLILLNDQSSWRITRTSANDMRYSRFNILFIKFHIC